MADVAAVTDGAAKLQLDEETGEMVSKNELKKRMQKRAKKAAAAENKAKATPESSAAKPKPKPGGKERTEEGVLDPDNMFKVGFLDEVYKIRPTEKGGVRTRFPPEPNGFLHIGHAKAIAVNFGFARYHGGTCVLRYDDTNPEAELEVYFTAILEMVEWLGFKPARITYSSDNFQKLYDHAEKLIGLDKAYVCHCGDADIKLQRGGEKGTSPRFRCEHAKQTPEENLAKFRDMRDGVYKPQQAFLRMKQNIEDGNPQMWDLAAYRVLDAPHHRTGRDWKIYPTYDMAHSLCDAFEGITHSLCTTEFILSRVSYEWLNNSLEVFPSMQREYGRLVIAGTVLSKRKILKLVEEKVVRSWDDPRLFTLIALKRRGIPPGAILEFVNELGVTTSASIIEIKRFEQAVRKYLERTVPRLMMVLDPIPVTIEDMGNLVGTSLSVPFSPKDPAMGSHDVVLTETVYIDRSDFREVDDPNFYRLTPGKSVGLLQLPHPIRVVSLTKDESTGAVTHIRAAFDRELKKPKTYIQWVPDGAGSQVVEVRIHERLFKSSNPSAAEGGFLSDINPDSETVHSGARIEAGGFAEVKRRAPWPEAAGESELGKGGPESVRFQALRIGYFAMDSDSKDDAAVLNRIVPLKEDAGKS